MQIEQRLLPVNVALAMLDPHEYDFPTPFADAGYTLAFLEVPLETEEGDVIADIVGATPDRSKFLIIECKDGHAPKSRQARSYLAAEWEELIRATGVEVPERPSQTEVHVVYVGTDSEADELRERMEDKSIDEIPVITAGGAEVRLLGESSDPSINEAEWPLTSDLPPPIRIPFDHQSDVEMATDPVAAELVGHLTRARGFEAEAYTIPFEDLLRRVVPTYDHISDPKAARGIRRLVGRAVEAVMLAAPHVFGHTRNEDGEASIAILSTPEAHKLQGRTQSYQAVLRQLDRQTDEDQVAPPTLFNWEEEE